MKYAGLIAEWVFILCIPVVLFTGSIHYAANSLWLYKYSFSEYNVSAATGISEEELEKAASDLISYFNSCEEYVTLTIEKDGKPFVLFNREEVVHMKDVKGLFMLDYFVLLGTAVYVLGYAALCIFYRKADLRRRLAKGVIWGSGITLAVLLALWVGMLLNFDWLFLQFHLLSFTNEFWSAEGYMVMLFPSGFWYDAALFCVVFMAGAAAIIGAGAGGYLLLTGRSLQFKKRIS